MAAPAAWRANDVVAYEAMRESATALIALLLRRATDGSDPLGEATKLRQDVLEVDAYDRAAVTALAARIAHRAAELSGGHE